MVLDDIFVVVHSAGLHPAQVFRRPNVQPFPHGHLAGGGVCPGVNRGRGRLKLLGDLLLGFPGGSLLLTRSGVDTGGVAGLPVCIFLPRAGHGLFPNGAGSLGCSSWHKISSLYCVLVPL